MAIIQGNAKQGSTRGFYPKVINGSLRFNDDDSAYLSWTPASAGNRKTWTWSGWLKRSSFGADQILLALYLNGGNDQSMIRLRNGGVLQFGHWNGAGYDFDLRTSALLRDVSAWYHIVCVLDTTNATAADRARIYINGDRVTAFDTESYPSQNYEGDINSTNAHGLGAFPNNLNYLDGYLANVHFIDGQALTASDFGETKNGVWVAKDYAGTFGTNGFYLTFEDDTQVEAFNTVLYRGNGGTQSITGVGFQPDLVWLKSRSSAFSNFLADSVRGNTKYLISNATNAESTATNYITSFDNDGFTVGNAGGSINENGGSIVAWCWKAGDSNVSNTDGTITSTVRANDTYGFSIVSYTGVGAGSAANEIQVGHGLSSAPKLVIVKNRSNTGDWFVFTTVIDGSNDYLYLNQTAAKGDSGNNAPTADVFYAGGSLNTSGNNYIAYCWSETTGYSKFGSYTGTGSAGNAVTGLGFTPAFLMIKGSDVAEHWMMYDNTRSVVNPIDDYLLANGSGAEATGQTARSVDFDSDGFTVDGTGTEVNQSGKTYIYAAFADTREAAFWLDQSGNDNDWQPVNLDHNDTVADSPTNNFATFNAIDLGAQTALSEGNLRFTATSSVWNTQFATMAPTSGKWYCELEVIYKATSSRVALGIATQSVSSGAFAGTSPEAYVYYDKGEFYHNGVVGSANFLTAMSIGDIVGLALDLDNHSVSWYLNNTLQRTETNIDSSLNWFIITNGYNGGIGEINFGQQDFTYTPPTGFNALSTANLPDPVIDPAQGASPEDYFNTVLYTGNGSTNAVTGVGFQPDFLWLKARSATGYDHVLQNVITGSTNQLYTNSTSAEVSDTDAITSFDTDGFTSGADVTTNNSGVTYVAWNWKANGSGVTNNVGSITSTVSANTTSGFSIVDLTDPNTGASYEVGHGLNSPPEMFFIKKTNTTSDWSVYHKDVGNDRRLVLNSTDGQSGSSSVYFGSTTPTSTVVTIGSGLSTGDDWIMYCFHSVEGFSRFSSYVGNGSTDGPFVYTGFQVRFLMYKNADATNAWVIYDNDRDPNGNPQSYYLLPNTSDAEGTTPDAVDFLSNGFKIRFANASINTSGQKHIFMAFASNPFKFSTAS